MLGKEVSAGAEMVFNITAIRTCSLLPTQCFYFVCRLGASCCSSQFVLLLAKAITWQVRAIIVNIFAADIVYLFALTLIYLGCVASVAAGCKLLCLNLPPPILQLLKCSSRTAIKQRIVTMSTFLVFCFLC